MSDPGTGAWGQVWAPRRGRSRLGSFPISIGTAVRGGIKRRPICRAARTASLCCVNAFLRCLARLDYAIGERSRSTWGVEGGG